MSTVDPHEGFIAVLFDCPAPADALALLEKLADACGDGSVASIGAGAAPAGWADLPVTLTEAEHVALIAHRPGNRRS